jgi:hypothetical protein
MVKYMKEEKIIMLRLKIKKKLGSRIITIPLFLLGLVPRI